MSFRKLGVLEFRARIFTYFGSNNILQPAFALDKRSQQVPTKTSNKFEVVLPVM